MHWCSVVVVVVANVVDVVDVVADVVADVVDDVVDDVVRCSLFVVRCLLFRRFSVPPTALRAAGR